MLAFCPPHFFFFFFAAPHVTLRYRPPKVCAIRPSTTPPPLPPTPALHRRSEGSRRDGQRCSRAESCTTRPPAEASPRLPPCPPSTRRRRRRSRGIQAVETPSDAVRESVRGSGCEPVRGSVGGPVPELFPRRSAVMPGDSDRSETTHRWVGPQGQDGARN